MFDKNTIVFTVLDNGRDESGNLRVSVVTKNSFANEVIDKEKMAITNLRLSELYVTMYDLSRTFNELNYAVLFEVG